MESRKGVGSDGGAGGRGGNGGGPGRDNVGDKAGDGGNGGNGGNATAYVGWPRAGIFPVFVIWMRLCVSSSGRRACGQGVRPNPGKRLH